MLDCSLKFRHRLSIENDETRPVKKLVHRSNMRHNCTNGEIFDIKKTWSDLYLDRCDFNPDCGGGGFSSCEGAIVNL